MQTTFHRNKKSAVFNIKKPVGISSFQIVRQLKKQLEILKIGYLGTLDPLAEGVLPIFIGNATKLIPCFEDSNKQYEAVFRFGASSQTLDREGEIFFHQMPSITLQQIQQIIPEFIGTIEQTPPIFSAIKIQGKRAYKYARQGETVVLEKRNITIYSLEIINWSTPFLHVKVNCSKGTYIRSLGGSIAQKLSTTAILWSLVRNASGKFYIENSIEPQNIIPTTLNSKNNLLTQKQFFFGIFFTFSVDAEQLTELLKVKELCISTPIEETNKPILAVCKETNEIIALGKIIYKKRKKYFISSQILL